MASLNTARGAINSLCTELQQNNSARVIVQGARELGNGFARIVATVTHARDSRKSKDVLVNALRSKFSNKMHVVADSFTVLSSNSISDTVTGIMSMAPQSVAYSDNIAGFKSLSGNMFMDEEEGLWALRKTEAGEILVKALGADDAEAVSGLLQSVSSVSFAGAYESTAAVAASDAMVAGVAGGDFITYVDPDSHTVAFGAVVASVANEDGTDNGHLCIIGKDNGITQIIDRGMVLASWDGVQVPDVEESVAASANNAHSLEDIASYYESLFRRDPAYFEEFMSRWRSHTFA